VSKLRRRLLDQFGLEDLNALFYSSRWALRFDLGGEWPVQGGQVPRMLQALERARVVTEAVFASSEVVDALIIKWGVRRPGARNPAFRRLASMGFRPALRYEGAYRDPEHDDDEPKMRDYYFLGGPTDPNDRAVLIWDSCGSEIGVEPSSPFISLDGADQFRSLLIDFERGILVNVYDDRGMDVVALDQETLQPFYGRFGEWLLDYDRAQMAVTFGAVGPER
jgi:hypothetical protein